MIEDIGPIISEYPAKGYAVPLAQCGWSIGASQLTLLDLELRQHFPNDHSIAFPLVLYRNRVTLTVDLDRVYIRNEDSVRVKQFTDAALDVMEAWITTQSMFGVTALIAIYNMKQHRRQLNKDTGEWEDEDG